MCVYVRVGVFVCIFLWGTRGRSIEYECNNYFTKNLDQFDENYTLVNLKLISFVTKIYLLKYSYYAIPGYV